MAKKELTVITGFLEAALRTKAESRYKCKSVTAGDQMRF